MSEPERKDSLNIPMSWRYGLIKVADKEDWQDDDTCELVELYLDKGGEPTSFCSARLGSVEELERALKDARKYGVYEGFFDTGTFKWALDGSSGWEWNPK